MDDRNKLRDKFKEETGKDIAYNIGSYTDWLEIKLLEELNFDEEPCNSKNKCYNSLDILTNKCGICSFVKVEWRGKIYHECTVCGYKVFNRPF